MCGICGIISKSGQPIDESMLHTMTDVMIHRGPDDDGYFMNESVGLGFRRLSIVDLKEGHQPLTNEDKSVLVVCNGEIYNYQSLRRGLVQRGHQFTSHVDTEVIAHLYEEKGIACLNDLRGMFALAIYDERRDVVYLARDYFGIKPLFYADTNHEFLFSSDIKSLLASKRVTPEVNQQSLWNYLTFQYVPDPSTMLQGIHKVPAAHFLKYEHGKIEICRYWEAEFKPNEKRTLEDFVDGVEQRLRESVKLHMSGDVPSGALLSCGVDSSAISALMAEQDDIHTFSVGFVGAADGFNELALARETAQYLGTHHHSLEITPERYLDELPRLIYHQEDPVADPSAIALHFVSELASSYVTTILSGEGADEIFGGYPIYHEPMSLRMFDYLPTRFRGGLEQFAQRLPKGMKGRSFLERGALPLERRFIGNAKMFTDDVKNELLQMDRFPGMNSSFDVTDPIYQRTSHLDAVTQMQAIDMHTWLPGDILMKADKMTMVNSVELRVPFLDRDLFEFAATIPTKFRLSHGQSKYVLRQAVKKFLPDAVSTRPKLGFPVPMRQWIMGGPMLDFVWDVLHTGGAMDFFNMTYIDKLIYEHVHGVHNHARQIWSVVTFALWHQIFIENSRVFQPSISPRVQVRKRRMADEDGAAAWKEVEEACSFATPHP